MDVPVNPASGEFWSERFEQLQAIATLLKYGDEENERLNAEYKSLTEGVVFKKIPYFAERIFAAGKEVNCNPEQLPKVYSCHPDTWEQLDAETKAKYKLWKVEA